MFSQKLSRIFQDCVSKNIVKCCSRPQVHFYQKSFPKVWKFDHPWYTCYLWSDWIHNQKEICRRKFQLCIEIENAGRSLTFLNAGQLVYTLRSRCTYKTSAVSVVICVPCTFKHTFTRFVCRYTSVVQMLIQHLLDTWLSFSRLECLRHYEELHLHKYTWVYRTIL